MTVKVGDCLVIHNFNSLKFYSCIEFINNKQPFQNVTTQATTESEIPDTRIKSITLKICIKNKYLLFVQKAITIDSLHG